jgi:hypothetical protein
MLVLPCPGSEIIRNRFMDNRDGIRGFGEFSPVCPDIFIDPVNIYTVYPTDAAQYDGVAFSNHKRHELIR